MILSLFKKDPEKTVAASIYDSVVDAARQPAFFADCGVPDTVEGRFEVLILFMFLSLRRLKKSGATTRSLAQKLFDVFFKNMDHTLRELGVGDLSVAKRVRKMAEAFYGRTGAYDAAIDNSDVIALTEKIILNVYGTTPSNSSDSVEASGAASIANYMLMTDAQLDEQDDAALLAGVIHFHQFSPCSTGVGDNVHV